MSRLRWLLPLAIFVALGASAPEPETWIRTHAIPLKTVEAGHGFDDLQPLAKVVGDARIDDSLDHALASAGIPLFALDLRQLPPQGPVAQWFAEPRSARSIGAVYGGGQPPEWSIATLRWPEVFDVILFVEKTTAARANP